MLIIILFFIQALSQLHFPFTCDCWEHKTEVACTAHMCTWDATIIDSKKCRTKTCSERSNDDILQCVQPSQYYSTNRTSCYMTNIGLSSQKCVEFQSCGKMDVSKISTYFARNLCKLNFCQYNSITKRCQAQDNCTAIANPSDCNNFFINDLVSLYQPSAYCYYQGDTCQTATEFWGECGSIPEQTLCTVHGCSWQNSECKNMNCTYISQANCDKENMDSFGNLWLCRMKNGACVNETLATVSETRCNAMMAHTYDEGDEICKPCLSLDRYLNPIVFGEGAFMIILQYLYILLQ